MAMMNSSFPLRDQCDQVLMINHGRVILWLMFMQSLTELQDMYSHILQHVYNFTPIIREDGELHLQFTNLYDSRLSSAFYVLFTTWSHLQMTK